MGKSQESYSKKEKEKKRRKKKQDKMERRKERKAAKDAAGKKTFEDMLSYVDENGNLTDTPPDPKKKKKIKVEDIVIGVPPKDDTPEDPIRKGTVKFFNDEKGYGFITDHETQDSVFVHANNLEIDIRDGDKVQFEVEMGQKGPNAVRVSMIK
ncbi:MAG: cold shock domain-containing protein [Bacteroidetes bacterium]|nr:cold shock domain-containing protein [Bacteroidota bacterium]